MKQKTTQQKMTFNDQDMDAYVKLMRNLQDDGDPVDKDLEEALDEAANLLDLMNDVEKTLSKS